MLVGLKTNLDEHGNLKWPTWLNRGLDVDVIVSEVRETSRKPEEVYGMAERMCPGGRKLGMLTQSPWPIGSPVFQKSLVESTTRDQGKVAIMTSDYMLTSLI